jgi:hypothetical protein
MGPAVGPAWRNDDVGFRKRTGSCKKSNNKAAAPLWRPDQRPRWKKGAPCHGIGRGEETEMRMDLEDRVAGIFGAGDVVSPCPDDLRARREEPLRRRCRHGRESCDFQGPQVRWRRRKKQTEDVWFSGATTPRPTFENEKPSRPLSRL